MKTMSGSAALLPQPRRGLGEAIRLVEVAGQLSEAGGVIRGMPAQAGLAELLRKRSQNSQCVSCLCQTAGFDGDVDATIQRPDPHERIIGAGSQVTHLLGCVPASVKRVDRPRRMEVVSEDVGQTAGVASLARERQGLIGQGRVAADNPDRTASPSPGARAIAHSDPGLL